MNQRGNAVVMVLVGLVLAAAGLFGWVMNILKLFEMGLDPLTGEAVLRIVGIFLAPLGAIMGFI